MEAQRNGHRFKTSQQTRTKTAIRLKRFRARKKVGGRLVIHFPNYSHVTRLSAKDLAEFKRRMQKFGFAAFSQIDGGHICWNRET